MKKPTRLFLGMKLGLRSEWKAYFAPCIATRSTKPDSVAKEIAEKEAKRENMANFYPVAATVQACVILDQDGNEVFAQSPSSFEVVPGAVSVQALTVIHTALEEEGLLADNPTMIDVQTRLFGLRIRDRLRAMALDAIRYGVVAKENTAPPVGLWYHRPFEPAPWTDPYEAMVPSELRNDIGFDGLCRYLGIDLDPTVEVDDDPWLQADLARRIALAGKLFPQ